MSGILFFTIAMCCVQFAAGTGYISHVEMPRCYDCDYDPKDETQNQGYHPGSSYSNNPKQSSHGTGKASVVTDKSDISVNDGRGFPRCALDRAADDQRYVRETDCQTGVCFIRKDHNGLVYRGCADPHNLPFGVDTNVQCQAQGLQPAVWWFCNGSLCNSGRFDGSSGICAGDKHNTGSNPPAGLSPGYAMPFSNPYTKNTQSEGSLTYGPPSAMENVVRPAPGLARGQTFEQVQQKLGYAGRNPVVYGGTGLTSEQTFQRLSAAAAASASPKIADNGANLLPQNPVPTSKTNAEATKAAGHVVQPEITVQTAIKGDGGKYQFQGWQQQQLQQVQTPVATAPAPAYGDANNRKVSATGSAQSDNSGTGEATPLGNQQPATIMVAPPGGADRNTNGDGYKTWDFIVLAQSRLQQLDDQLGAGDRGNVENNDIFPIAKTSQPAKTPQVNIFPDVKTPHASIAPAIKTPQQDIVPAPKAPQQDIGQQYRGSMPVSGVSVGYDSGSVIPAGPAPTLPPSRPYSKLAGEEIRQPAVELSTPVQPISVQNYVKQPQYVSSSSSKDAAAQTSETAGFNQCDGQCFDNPSGLFPDPSRRDGFIQCGPGMDLQSGLACHCCRPQRMRCPKNTTFDNITKVCSGTDGDLSEVNNQSEMSATYRR